MEVNYGKKPDIMKEIQKCIPNVMNLMKVK